MAIVKMFGRQFAVDLTKSLGLDTTGQQIWQAVSRAHTARTVPGTTIIVRQSEIVEAAAAEMPTDTDSGSAVLPSSLSSDTTGLAELETAMMEERKSLPTPAELIAQHRATIQPQAVSVSPDPTQAPARGPQHKSWKPR